MGFLICLSGGGPFSVRALNMGALAIRGLSFVFVWCGGSRRALRSFASFFVADDAGGKGSFIIVIQITKFQIE